MNLEQLTLSQQQSEKLVSLGIKAPAFLWHRKHLSDEGAAALKCSPWETGLFLRPVPGPEMLPAWTKAELDAMIGPDLEKPDIYPTHLIGKATDPNTYPIFLPKSLIVFNNGAHASAEALIFLIENQNVDPFKATERYRKMFNPCPL